jgi:putative toxin-antitoxin system antitoxin component (TIGR02293 family)
VPRQRAAAAATKTRGKVRPRVAPSDQGALGLLGLPPASASDLVAEVERGLPFSSLERFKLHTGLAWDAICALVQLPMRTLTRRRAAGRLDPAESDRLVRAARLFHQMLELFEGDEIAARAWLTRPQRGLGGATPLEFARTETGAREVELLLGRLEHGVVA